MASLCIYGILLILFANRNISPYSYFMSNIYSNSTTLVTSGEVTHQTISPQNSTVLSMTNVSHFDSASNTTSQQNTTQNGTVLIQNATSKSPTPKEDAILTIFTTFKNTPTKDHIYKNTIRNWALLAPYVKPVMYLIPGKVYCFIYFMSLFL